MCKTRAYNLIYKYLVRHIPNTIFSFLHAHVELLQAEANKGKNPRRSTAHTGRCCLAASGAASIRPGIHRFQCQGHNRHKPPAGTCQPRSRLAAGGPGVESGSLHRGAREHAARRPLQRLREGKGGNWGPNESDFGVRSWGYFVLLGVRFFCEGRD